MKSFVTNLLKEIKFKSKFILLRDLRRALNKNIDLKDSKKGKRCFVLGNGPSLNLYDLSCLKNEDVFCVNEFVRYPFINNICPKYYFLADPKFFDMDTSDEGDLRLINLILEYGKANTGTKLFIPVGALKNTNRYSWNQYFEIHSYYPSYQFDSEYKKNIDFCGAIPQMNAVVQYAILLAIYMGYDEIYLLGTDQTNIFGNIKAFLNEESASDYAFNMSKSEKEWKNKKLTSYSLPFTLRGYARIFEIYDELALYCKRKGVLLYNCAPETLIQGIEKADFEQLFK